MEVEEAQSLCASVAHRSGKIKSAAPTIAATAATAGSITSFVYHIAVHKYHILPVPPWRLVLRGPHNNAPGLPRAECEKQPYIAKPGQTKGKAEIMAHPTTSHSFCLPASGVAAKSCNRCCHTN